MNLVGLWGRVVGMTCVALAVAGVTSPCAFSKGPRVLDQTSRDTLTVAEMNHGDELRFKLRNGEVRTFILENTSARILEKVPGGILYSFDCRIRADGQPLTLRRYVCSQETFYEPWVVNGVRLWVSSSAAVFKLVPIRYPEAHYKFDSDAVLVVQDATLPICPQPIRPWFPLDRLFIDVADCYNGDDPWLGPYLGQACHVGLDINMPRGTLLSAPIDFDNQWIFDADHRWRGVRIWPNGDIWGLQSHHVDKLLVDERTPLKAGAVYAEVAGKGIGSHPHSHFEFRLGPGALNRGKLGGIEIDPWILFWQMFETAREERGLIRAAMAPLSPVRVGETVKFSPQGAHASRTGGPLRHFWTFGDGGGSDLETPEHIFTRPGVYPITLVVDDGRERASHTQHLTVAGERLDKAALILEAPDEMTFQPRPAEAADVYGWPIAFIPHTLTMATVPGGVSAPRTVHLRNTGGDVLPQSETPQVAYLDPAKEWLTARLEGQGNEQRVVLTASAAGLATGRYEAIVSVHCPGAMNGRQSFRIELVVRPAREAVEVIVDDRDPGFYATPYFWVGHQFLRAKQKGHQGRYLTNGARAEAGARVRFTPDLAAGRYEVLLHEKSPLPDALMPIRVHHAHGDANLQYTTTQAETRSLGIFEFVEGTDGFVEIQAEGSRGLVVADAMVFRPVAPRQGPARVNDLP